MTSPGLTVKDSSVRWSFDPEKAGREVTLPFFMVFAGFLICRPIDKYPDFLAKADKSSEVLENGSIFREQ